ncbi:hypothetical protein B0H21DRAFT_835803 [Amylocystis lapponica]|nr:hypothetical protein B0H21DRAFT_835803 [Amylocystis lapponica]
MSMHDNYVLNELILYVNSRRNEAAMEMKHYLVQIGWDEFMSKLTAGRDPTPEERVQFMDFSRVKLDGTEAQMYAPICSTAKSALNVLTQNDLIMKNIADWPDPHDGEDSDLGPDVGICPTTDATLAEYELTKEEILASKQKVPEASRHRMARISWNWLCIPFKFKRGDNNVPFESGHSDAKKFLKETQDNETAQDVKTAQEQMADPHARLMRWDRAGAVVTESFNYVECPDKMRTFIYRLGKMNNRQRGYDPTVSLASADDADEMKTCGGDLSKLSSTRRKYLAEATKVGWPIYEIKFHPEDFEDDAAVARTRYSFLVGRPQSALRSPYSRATKGYVAYDIDTKKLRKTYQRLHAKGIRFIATLICAGDVGVPAQQMRTHVFASEIGQVGRPLEDYEHSYEMVTVMQDALQAHEDAWLKAEVLHGDISPGNILINDDTEDGDYHRVVNSKRPIGFLNDWDSCKYKEDLTERATCDRRSGTWQFMSALLLWYPGKSSELSDDLEAFVHTMTWLSLKYHSIPENDRDGLEFHIYSTYEHRGISRHGDHIGSLEKLFLMQTGRQKFPIAPDTCFEPPSTIVLPPANPLFALALAANPHRLSDPLACVRAPPTYRTHVRTSHSVLERSDILRASDRFRCPRPTAPDPETRWTCYVTDITKALLNFAEDSDLTTGVSPLPAVFLMVIPLSIRTSSAVSDSFAQYHWLCDLFARVSPAAWL